MKKEDIPDDDFLFRRSSCETFDKKRYRFTAPTFMLRKNKGEKGLSVNWSKYSTPEKTSICPITGKRFYVGKVKAIIPREVDLDVNHTPSKHNKAHCTICGDQLYDDLKAYEIAEYIAEKCIPVIISL